MLQLETSQFANYITIHGIPCTNLTRGGSASYTVFKTNPREIATRLYERFINTNSTLGPLILRLNNDIYDVTLPKGHTPISGVSQEMYVSGDMLIVPPDAACVHILDALRVLGKHCGAFFGLDDTHHRVVYNEEPAPALEWQETLATYGCWDTTKILTTDADAINLHKLFKETEKAINAYFLEGIVSTTPTDGVPLVGA